MVSIENVAPAHDRMWNIALAIISMWIVAPAQDSMQNVALANDVNV